jgi:hypothetical protein
MLRYNTTANGLQGYNGTAERFLPWADADNWVSGSIPYSNGSALTSHDYFKYNGSELLIGTKGDAGDYQIQSTTGMYMARGTFRIEGWGGDAQLYITAKATAGAPLYVNSPDYAAARLKTAGTSTSTVIESAGGYPLTIYPEFSGDHNTKRGTIKFSTKQFLNGCCGDPLSSLDEGGYRMLWEAYRQIGGWVNLGYMDTYSPPATDAASSDGVIDFWVANNASATMGLSIDGEYLGVGVFTQNPTAKLDVNGNARIRTLSDSVTTYITTADASGYLYRATPADIVAAGYYLAYGEFSAADTISITSSTPVKMEGSAAGEILNVSYSSGRLTYTGSSTHTFSCIFSASIDASASTEVSFWIYKNGNPVATSKSTHAVTAGSITSVGTQALISLAQDDYIEVFFDVASSCDVYIRNSNLKIEKL